jgi:hypothetical protein
MRIHWKSVFVLAVLVLAAGAAAQDPLPKVDSWRHQRPPGTPAVETPPAKPPAAERSRKTVAPKEQQEGQPKVVAPPPVAAPAFQPAPAAAPAFQPAPVAVSPELLLNDALGKLAPQRPGVHDLYFLAFAGWGDQNVFRKEAERVRALFDSRFGTKDRSLILVNSPETITQYPGATLDNLRAALAIIGQQMDKKEDVLVLFLTSHGEQNRGIVTRLNGKDLGLLTPRILAAALDEAGIKNRIVMISACFAGQFVTALESEDSLVIAAAAANRMSFGCTTSAEWTWFGESYFVNALPKAGKFVPAFARAKELVASKETEEKMMPSQPQISVGRNIERILTSLGY